MGINNRYKHIAQETVSPKVSAFRQRQKHNSLKTADERLQSGDGKNLHLPSDHHTLGLPEPVFDRKKSSQQTLRFEVRNHQKYT